MFLIESGTWRVQVLEMELDPDQLLPASDVARILELSRDIVRVWGQSGWPRSTRAANGYYLFRRCDVEELAGQRAQARKSHQRRGSHG